MRVPLSGFKPPVNGLQELAFVIGDDIHVYELPEDVAGEIITNGFAELTPDGEIGEA